MLILKFTLDTGFNNLNFTTLVILLVVEIYIGRSTDNYIKRQMKKAPPTLTIFLLLTNKVVIEFLMLRSINIIQLLFVSHNNKGLKLFPLYKL